VSKYSSLLYAQPSFLEGVGRLMDAAGLLERYNYSATPGEADTVLIASDWCAVGEDLRSAILDFAKRQGIVIRDA
jgi:hypothetical protein